MEFRRVYTWRAIIRTRTRTIAEWLRAHQVGPAPDEDAIAFVRRWVRGDVNEAPRYVCLACQQPLGSGEVPA